MLDVEYTKFKDDTVKGIREDEEQYAKLQEQIRALEAEIEAETEGKALRDAPTPAPSSRPVDAIEVPKVEKSIINTPKSTEPAPTVSTQLSPSIPQLQPPLVPYERILPPPISQINDHGPTPEQQGLVPGLLPPNARTFPAQAGLSPMHPPLDLHTANRRPPSGSAPGRGSPLPYPTQQQAHFQHQQYPPYNQPQNLRPLQQPYPQSHSPHPGAYYYPNGPPHQGMAPANTPIQPQFQYYAQSALVNHYNRNQPQPQQMPMPMPYPPYAPSASAGTAPVWRIDGTPSRQPVSSTSTPWKRKPSNVAGLRVPSPERPREVSPLSDVESPVQAAKTKGNATQPKSKPKKQEGASQKAPENRGTRRGRAGSTASSTVDRSTRSQSIASLASDSKPPPSNKSRASREIKPEPTSADAPFPSDGEIQRSSGRRRTRGDTLTSHEAPARPNLKRRRDSVPDSSPIPSSPPYQRPRRQRPLQDPTLVSVSKTFIRVASQLLQRVTEHKYASIFAKALSEREAPGYKGLILRPQDLKSIKAAVTRGSKAAVAAIEELEQGTGGSPTLIKITEDLVPPKGIVNMDQLEKELMRMFANAIMFNPLPNAERGLRPRRSLRLSSTPSQIGELGYAGSEEGGIVQDAREMCGDVVALIQTFKAAEQDRPEAEQS
jgi:hypothetical protein